MAKLKGTPDAQFFHESTRCGYLNTKERLQREGEYKLSFSENGRLAIYCKKVSAKTVCG
jgi:hypothetical protein